MTKKGFIMITAALLLCSIVTLQARERRSMLNSNVMDYMPRRSHRFNKYPVAEIFRVDGIRNIDFHSISILLDGTLGWASTSADGYGAMPMTIGKIYIRGLFLPQGNTWEGRVYPTNHFVIIRRRTYPIFQLQPVKQNGK